LLFFLAATAWAVDPHKFMSQYRHTAWRTQDGAFSGTPRRIAQTADGYIWIGTVIGLVRFDGIRFVPWIPPEGQELPSPRINSLLATPDGSLWIGTALGLSRWQNNRLTNYANTEGVVTAIIQAHDGTIWIQKTPSTGSVGPLCQVVESGMRCHGKAEGIPDGIYQWLIQDTHGYFWIGGQTNLVRWAPDSQKVYAPNALKSRSGSLGVGNLAPDPDGSLWVGMTGSGPGLGLQHLTRDIWKPFPLGLQSNSGVESLYLDRQKALWVGTEKQGVYRISDNRIEHFGSADGLSGDTVLGLCEDKEGNVWVATTNGIDRFSEMSISSFSIREGITSEEVDSIIASKDGGILIGGPGSLQHLGPAGLTSVLAGKDLLGQQVTSLFEDHNGLLWVGIDDGLRVYEGQRFRRINRRDGTPTGMIVGITEDTDHNIWVESKGPGRPLIRIHNLEIKEEFPSPTMPAARRVEEDHGGGLWLGLMNGDLAHYQHGRIETFPFQHVPDSRVEQVTVNPDGSVLGAAAFGLIGWRDGKQLTLTTRNGLPCDSVYSFASDDHSNLWLYTQCGLVEITKQDVQKWWENPGVMLQPKLFDALDGAQTDWAPFQGAAKSHDGRLWFASGFLLQTIDPNHMAENSIAPPVHVEGMVADGHDYLPRAGLVLPALTRDVEIDYTALSFVAPQRVRFRYKLENRDSIWQEPGTRRQAFYTDLRPGTYHFRVIACNNDGVWNEEGARLDFIVAPAWYQTNWFQLLCAITALLVVWAMYRLRVRQITRAASASFDGRLQERTRMARDLHDTFLQTIQGSKLVADDALDASTDPVRMRRAMEQLSVWLGRATEEGRAALNSLRTSTTEKNDLAAAFRRAIEECRIHSSMKASLSVVGEMREMHPIVRDEVYRIGYEAIRNACVHSQASQLQVELTYDHDLALRMSDNGVGMDSAFVDRGKDGHFGLQGMRERAARIVGKLTVVSSDASGTEIKLVVPGSIVYSKPTSASQSLRGKIKSLFRRMDRTSKPN
jgi:signal transduction histidine kinase/ligand-binding sensor domain-containing protein